MTLPLHVRVPATSANLGPGFDCLGLALTLYLEVAASIATSDSFYYRGEGALPNSSDNLIHQGFRAAYQTLGQTPPKVRFDVYNPIPLARGLGSSSAALVAGIAIADHWLDEALGPEGIFQLSARIEKHPDNVAPAVFGGFTVSAQREDSHYHCEHLAVPESWQLLFGVPAFELLTREARAVLPQSYPRADLIYNASRTAFWSLAVAQDKPELLRLASQDRVHEPYRAPLVAGLNEYKKQLLAAGAYAAFLSGAGPSIGVICKQSDKETCKDILKGFVGSAGKILDLNSSQGYQIIRLAAPAQRMY